MEYKDVENAEHTQMKHQVSEGRKCTEQDRVMGRNPGSSCAERSPGGESPTGEEEGKELRKWDSVGLPGTPKLQHFVIRTNRQNTHNQEA